MSSPIEFPGVIGVSYKEEDMNWWYSLVSNLSTIPVSIMTSDQRWTIFLMLGDFRHICLLQIVVTQHFNECIQRTVDASLKSGT